MATDSSASGFLAPSSQDVYDNALDDLLQAAIVGITGITGSLVRPRWQPEPPTQPDFAVDWCAFGIVDLDPDTFSFERHDPTGNGSTAVEEDEILTVLHSFYGPHASQLCERFRKGISITQNRDTLYSSGILLTEVQGAIVIPALLKEKWVKRVDVRVIYRRRTSTSYAILNVQSGQLGLNNGLWATPITTP